MLVSKQLHDQMVCAEQPKYFSVELLMGHKKEKKGGWEGSRTKQKPHINTLYWTQLSSPHIKQYETKFHKSSTFWSK